MRHYFFNVVMYMPTKKLKRGLRNSKKLRGGMFGFSSKPTGCKNDKDCEKLISYENELTLHGYTKLKNVRMYTKTNMKKYFKESDFYDLLEKLIDGQKLVGTEIIRYKTFIKWIATLMHDTQNDKDGDKLIHNIDARGAQFVKTFLEGFFEPYDFKPKVVNGKVIQPTQFVCEGDPEWCHYLNSVLENLNNGHKYTGILPTAVEPQMGKYMMQSGSYQVLDKVIEGKQLSDEEIHNYKLLLIILKGLLNESIIPKHKEHAAKIDSIISTANFEVADAIFFKKFLNSYFATIQTLALRVDELTERIEAMENKAGNSKIVQGNKNSKIGNVATTNPNGVTRSP